MVEANVVGAPLLTRSEGLAAGRELRKKIPHTDLASITTSGRDPLGILRQQDSTRVRELVPLRAERMAASAFAFYRGTAAIMAADFGREPHTGLLVPSCGDAHISNFGFFASPQRTLVFDLNDFDEAAWAPWEWDLKRLVASVVIGARESRGSAVADDAARVSVVAYARALRAAVRTEPLQRYYAHFDADASQELLDGASRSALKSAIAAAEKRTGKRAARKLTVIGDDGKPRFIEQPPVMTHADPEIRANGDESFGQYVASANVDIQLVLRQYQLNDVARRVVGVGSVGTRCYLTLLSTPDAEPLIMQVKEAGRSVLVEYGGIAQPEELSAIIDAGGEGARVVNLQRVLQAFSDPFLGHIRAPRQDYYVRQFHDMKGSIDTDVLEDASYREYAIACAITLARAHAQANTAPSVSGYVGKGRKLARVLVAWANAYADLAADDYRAFVAAAEDNAAEDNKENAV